eukprot:5917502-Pleurochrysis_carterae.AAC.1
MQRAEADAAHACRESNEFRRVRCDAVFRVCRRSTYGAVFRVCRPGRAIWWARWTAATASLSMTSSTRQARCGSAALLTRGWAAKPRRMR